MAAEGDPIEVETCQHLVAEIERRIHEVTILGNYWSVLPRQPGETMRMQEYRNHQPCGEPKVYHR